MEMRPCERLLRIEAEVGAQISGGAHDVLEEFDFGFGGGVVVCRIVLRIGLERDRVSFALADPVPELFGEEGHQRVEQAEGLFEDFADRRYQLPEIFFSSMYQSQKSSQMKCQMVCAASW